MSALSPEQLAAIDYSVGFPAAAVPTAVAVEEAESSGDPGAVGDVTLADATYGPSVGAFQVRSLQAQMGTTHTDPTTGLPIWSQANERDAAANLDPYFNARSAFDISGGGRNWSAWSTFNSGAYRSFLGTAQAAAASPASAPPEGFVPPDNPAVSSSGGGLTVAPAGLGLHDIYQPWKIPGDLAGSAGSAVVSALGPVLGTVAGVVLGLGLIGVGVVKLVSPDRKLTEVMANFGPGAMPSGGSGSSGVAAAAPEAAVLA